MKQNNFLKLLFLFLVLTASSSVGQIASWDLTTNGDASGVDANMSASALTVTGTGSVSFGTSGAFANTWSTGAIDTGKYFEITVSPNSGFQINITDINFGERRSGTGIRDYQVRWSIDDFASENTIATVNVPDNTSERTGDISGLSIDVADGETLKIRWYGYNAEASGGTWRINNATLNLAGSVSASSPVIGFDSASSGVNETNGTVNTLIPITMSSHDGNQVDLSIAVTGGTAEMADYTLNTTSLSYTGDGSQNVSLDINADAGFDDETIILTITETSSVTGLVISQATHTVTVTDDESPPTIGFDSATSGENETNATFTGSNIPITVSGYDGNQIDINIAVTGGTAEGGDYSLNTTSLSFTGDGSQNVTVDINDDADSDDETIILTITETSSVTGLVISQATHTLTITDDETPALPTAGTVFITEVVDASSFSYDYLELYNNSNESISLSTSKLVRASASTNASEYVFDFGADESTADVDVTIPAYGFLIIARGGTRADFNTDFSITLPVSVNYNGGNSNLFFGNGRRWRLRVGGTANTDDGTLIDDTSSGVGSDKDYRNIFTDTFVSGTLANATPGELEYLLYAGGAWVNSTSIDGTTGAKDAYFYDSFTVSANSAANAVGVSSGQTLTINSGVSLTANGNLTNSGTLTVNSDATSSGSLIVLGTSTGDITYNRYVTFNATGTLGWHLVGSPVVSETVQDIITNGSLADGSGGGRKGLATYDNDQNDVSFGSWVYTTAASTGSMDSGVGYSIKRNAAGTIPFTGTLKTDDLSSYAIDVGTENAWNLLSNPYPSFININTAADATNYFLTTAVINQLDAASAAVYVWDSEANSGNGAYSAINNSSGASYLAPGQGFFLASAAGGGSINITEVMQTHQSGDLFLRNTITRPEIELQITDGTFVKNTEIKYIDTNVSTGLDPGYDAKLFDATDNSFAVYTQLLSDNQGLDFMLQAIPNTNHEGMIIPVGMNADAGAEITFTANVINIPNGLNVFLEDREMNTFTQLDISNGAYTITLANSSNGIGRFYLHMNTESALSTNSFDLNTVSIYKTSNTNLRVAGVRAGNVSLKIFDILGKQVMLTNFESNGLNDIALPSVKTGIYIVQLETDHGKLNKKIIIE